MTAPVDNTITRGALVAARAEEWIGTPFQWQGRVRAGCDCKGLLAGITTELGFPEAESLEALCGDYGPVVPAGRLRAGLETVFDRVSLAERREGDVLLVRLSGRAQHLAIAAPRPLQPTRVIEALIDAGMVRPFRRGDLQVDSLWRWREI